MAREKEIIANMKKQIDNKLLTLSIAWLINPPMVVSFGYLTPIKAWRVNLVQITSTGPQCLSDKNSLNCNDLLDDAFAALEATGAKLSIVLKDGSVSKYYP